MGVFMVCFIVFMILWVFACLFYVLLSVGRGVDVNEVNKDGKVKR